MFVTQFPVRGNYLAKNGFLGGRGTVGIMARRWHPGRSSVYWLLSIL
jgi:hypothetical protein